MTIVVIAQATGAEHANSNEPMRVVIHIDAEVMTAEAAMHEARTWLAAHISQLLGVATPELVVQDKRLFWRFEVMLALPNETQPGSGALYNVGQIWLDAATGAVQDAESLAADLRVHVASIAP
jgi:hypothetical protein